MKRYVVRKWKIGNSSIRIMAYDDGKSTVFIVQHRAFGKRYETLIDCDFETESGCAWAILDFLDGKFIS